MNQSTFAPILIPHRARKVNVGADERRKTWKESHEKVIDCVQTTTTRWDTKGKWRPSLGNLINGIIFVNKPTAGRKVFSKQLLFFKEGRLRYSCTAAVHTPSKEHRRFFLCRRIIPFLEPMVQGRFGHSSRVLIFIFCKLQMFVHYLFIE